jgi:soluble lytic murein transglycosylase-like protein
MARLKAPLGFLALASASPASADPVERWAEPIAEASARFGIPASWIRRVMRAESGGHTILHGRPIVSRAGAMGLMQLMTGTWREMRASLRLGHDPYDPRDNILAGAAYLRSMHDRFGYPGLFAAYNAGPARYARHLATGRPLPAETVAYVADVTGGGSDRARTAWSPATRPAATLFVFRAAPPAVPETAAPEPTNALFFRLNGTPDR